MRDGFVQAALVAAPIGPVVSLALPSRTRERHVQGDLGVFGSSGASLGAKTFAADGERTVAGSFSFDPRSTRLDTEMGPLIAALAREGRACFASSTRRFPGPFRGQAAGNRDGTPDMLGRASLQAALILALGLAAGAGRAQDLTVGANIGNVPWEFQDDTGAFVGFEIDLVQEIADRLGREVTIENIPFTGLFAAVQSGRIDMAVSSITITPERLTELSFAQPYYDSDQSLTVAAASGLASLEDMSGKVIGVDTGSTGDIWATEHQGEYGFGEIRRFEGLAPAMLDLGNGRIDGYISDIPALQYYVRDKPQFTVAERIPTGERYSIMFAKDSPLVAEVNDVITALKEEGFLAATHEKWFGSAPEEGTSTVQVMDLPDAE